MVWARVLPPLFDVVSPTLPPVPEPPAAAMVGAMLGLTVMVGLDSEALVPPVAEVSPTRPPVAEEVPPCAALVEVWSPLLPPVALLVPALVLSMEMDGVEPEPPEPLPMTNTVAGVTVWAWVWAPPVSDGLAVKVLPPLLEVLVPVTSPLRALPPLPPWAELVPPVPAPPWH